MMKELHSLHLTLQADLHRKLSQPENWERMLTQDSLSLSGWHHHCDPPSGWELGRRQAGRSSRHLSYLVCTGTWVSCLHLTQAFAEIHTCHSDAGSNSFLIWGLFQNELKSVKKRWEMITPSSGKEWRNGPFHSAYASVNWCNLS